MNLWNSEAIDLQDGNLIIWQQHTKKGNWVPQCDV